MAAGGTGPCGAANCPVPTLRQSSRGADPLSDATEPPLHAGRRRRHLRRLPGHDVNYVGATADGSKVYFTSEEQLTPEDTRHQR